MSVNKLVKVVSLILLLFILIILIREYKKAENLDSAFTSNPLNNSLIINEVQNSNVLKGMRLVRHSPEKFIRTSIDSCFISFEKTWFGTVEFDLSKIRAPIAIKLKLGEMATANHVINAPEIGMDSVGYFETLIEANNNAQKIQVLIPQRVLPNKKLLPFGLNGVLPFRYVEITEGCSFVMEDNIRQLALSYKFNEDYSYFISDNKILNDIYLLSKHTIIATSFAGLYIDGYRELKPYEADSYINQLGHYSIDSDYLMARKTQEYLLSNGTWPTEWAMHSIFMAYEDYMQTGDKKFLLENYETLKLRTLIDLANSNYLISSENQSVEFLKKAGIKAKALYDIIDWPIGEVDSYTTVPVKSNEYLWKSVTILLKEIRLALVELVQFNNTSRLYKADIVNLKNKLTVFPKVNTVVNAFHYAALNKMVFLASELDKLEDARFFESRANKLKASIQEFLFKKDVGLYIDSLGSSHSSRQANIFALKFGLVPVESINKVINFIIENDTGSVYLYQYLLEALYENNRSDAAYSILTSMSDRSWYHMIYDLGSSMTTESWNFGINPGMDMNHSWATAPVNIIPRYLAGLRSIKPRYSKFVVSPMDAELRYYSILIPTLDGTINLKMVRKENIITYHLIFSGDKIADIYVLKPDCEKINVTLNNLEVKTKDGERVAFLGVSEGKHLIVMKCVE